MKIDQYHTFEAEHYLRMTVTPALKEAEADLSAAEDKAADLFEAVLEAEKDLSISDAEADRRYDAWAVAAVYHKELEAIVERWTDIADCLKKIVADLQDLEDIQNDMGQA